jgi:cytochrome c biogenesis protein CcmG/thiol:disulfide interchange protein DsbE
MSTTGRQQPGRRDWLFWALMGAAVVVLVLGVVVSRRFGSDPTITSSPLIGKPVPQVTVAYLESEGRFDTSELDGDIAVINFWASWCFGCRQEHQALLAGAEAYSELGVTFLGINYQDRRRAPAIDFLDEVGRGENTLYLRDEGSRTAVEFGVLGLPETFFVDRDGTVVGKVSGPINGQLLTDTLNRILLGETIGQVKTGEVENRPG